MKYESESEQKAVLAWASQFSSIPTALVQRAFKGDDRDELELLAGGDKLSDCCDAEVMAAKDDDHVKCTKCGEHVDGDVAPSWHWSGPELDWPAGWGTMFAPDGMDESWMRDNAQAVAECGFVVYESDETGVLLGVDGAGYDFFEAHWLPLYRARGLRWHATEEEQMRKNAEAYLAAQAAPKRAPKKVAKVAKGRKPAAGKKKR